MHLVRGVTLEIERINRWPELPLHAWKDTYDTIHRWAQIVGKVQLGLTPPICHWWHTPLQVTPRGLGTGAIMTSEDRWLDMELDFFDDVLRIRVSDGTATTVPLAARSVADFYRDTLEALRREGIPVHITETPCEIVDNDFTPFSKDRHHASYDKKHVLAFWQILARATLLLTRFRGGWVGKSSPAQFFWGHMDLALSLFSGRKAPDEMVAALPSRLEREGYSHELFAAGWWAGDNRLEKPSFYSYVAPEPEGFAAAKITTPGAYYHPALHGFYLDYDTVRTAADPDALVLDFFQQTYNAAADLAHWDRAALERTGAMA